MNLHAKHMSISMGTFTEKNKKHYTLRCEQNFIYSLDNQLVYSLVHPINKYTIKIPPQLFHGAKKWLIAHYNIIIERSRQYFITIQS